MDRRPVITKDGSHTISVPGMNVTYHSLHGAITESMHVFIDAGLRSIISHENIDTVLIFEMGFGTGLNALLTLAEAEKTGISIHYTAIELHPMSQEEASLLNYCDQPFLADYKNAFLEIHRCPWETEQSITPQFSIRKINCSLLAFNPSASFDLIYFDAFAPGAQPELWTVEVFEKLFQWLAPGGILVTYSSKGDVKRSLQTAGFSVEKIPGPPGKREMLRAVKKK